MGGNFKFQAQDIFLEYFFISEIWRFEKQIALSEKKTPLAITSMSFCTPSRNLKTEIISLHIICTTLGI